MKIEFYEGGQTMSKWGKRVPGCAFCACADREKMKCYPGSQDCKSEYNLEEADFHKECNCDFFNRKN